MLCYQRFKPFASASIEPCWHVDHLGDREQPVKYGIIAGLEPDEQNHPEDPRVTGPSSDDRRERRRTPQTTNPAIRRNKKIKSIAWPPTPRRVTGL